MLNTPLNLYLVNPKLSFTRGKVTRSKILLIRSSDLPDDIILLIHFCSFTKVILMKKEKSYKSYFLYVLAKEIID